MAVVANTTLVVLALVLGVRLLTQFRVRRRPASLWYGVGLLLTASAAFPEVWYALTQTVPVALWWLYWSSASATVGFLAVGTGYLLSPRFGRACLASAALLTLAVVVATVLTGGSGPAEGATEFFAKAPTVPIKIPFLVQNILGSLVILIGATISYLRTRGLYNIWIALGTLVFAAGGASAGLINYSQVFYFTQTAGILLLYAGVTMAGRSRIGVQTAAG